MMMMQPQPQPTHQAAPVAQPQQSGLTPEQILAFMQARKGKGKQAAPAPAAPAAPAAPPMDPQTMATVMAAGAAPNDAMMGSLFSMLDPSQAAGMSQIFNAINDQAPVADAVPLTVEADANEEEEGPPAYGGVSVPLALVDEEVDEDEEEVDPFAAVAGGFDE